MIGTAITFSTLLVLTWAVSFFFGWLDEQHAFPAEIHRILTTVKVWLVYIDLGICGVVCFSAAAKFIQDDSEDT